LSDAGIDCVVVAPSKLIRPSADRVKTDVRDARHLARLLHLGEVTSVAVPWVQQEAARDLVRARDDCRGDLMSVRHPVSKLLLRQGIVYYGGETWTGKHEQWLRQQHFDHRGLQLAFDAAFDAMLATADRRDRLDGAIAEMAADSPFTAVADRLQCIRGISTLTAFGLAVEIGDWQRFTGRTIGAYWAWSPPSTPLERPAAKVVSPKPATAMCGDFSSRPPGITASPTDLGPACAGVGRPPHRRPGHAATPRIDVCIPGGSASTSVTNVP
jgi:transposase